MVNKGMKYFKSNPWRKCWPDFIADFDTLRYSACFTSPWTEWPAVAGCIEGHINITADFDILRYSACLNSPWTEWSAVAECTEGHINIIAGFDTLRYSACLYVLGNNLRTFRCSLSKSIYGGIHVYSQMCKRNVLRWEYKKFIKKNTRTWNGKWS